MAATSLFRLLIVFIILITLALSSSFAWGSLSLFADDAQPAVESLSPSPAIIDDGDAG